MLLIVGLSTSNGNFPIEALKEVDATLREAGFRKEVSSALKPGREYSITYEGPDTQKERIQGLLEGIAEKHHLALSIETEESVKFP